MLLYQRLNSPLSTVGVWTFETTPCMIKAKGGKTDGSSENRKIYSRLQKKTKSDAAAIGREAEYHRPGSIQMGKRSFP